MVIAALLVGCNGDDDELPDSGTVAALGFTYTMPDRFGLDGDNDGLLDLPNSCSYVLNERCPTTEEVGFTVDLTATGKVLVRGGGRTVEEHPISSGAWRWRIAGTKLSEPRTHETTDRTWTTELPEGTYEVSLSVEGTYGDGQTISGSRTAPLVVRDILIVSIGDSYASGEGNPERRSAIWADDGGSGVQLKHTRAHRSTLAGPAQAALMVERADPRYSVTFVSVAASGATVYEGLLGPYKGAVAEYQNLEALEPQLDEVRGIVGGRAIDFLIVSIGGNDMGFANVVKSLVVHRGPLDEGPENYVCAPPPDCTLQAIEAAIHDGNWNLVETAAIGDDTVLPLKNVPGLDALPVLYQRLNDKIDTLTVHNVLITTYPDPTEIVRGGTRQTCDQALTEVAPFHELSGDELAWASQNALRPLNWAIDDAAETHGWARIGHVLGIFTGHGICGDNPPYAFSNYSGNPYPDLVNPWPTSDSMRWFRRAKESRAIQGGTLTGTQGTLHPNEFGHRYIGEELSVHILTLIRVGEALEGLGS